MGLLLFLVASGLTLVFGILDFVNLAHGSLYMIGAFVCASLTFVVGNFLWAMVLALPITAVVGYALERTVIRTLYERDHLDQVLGTFGIILILDTSAHLIWGAEGIAVPLPTWLDGQVTFGTIVIPIYRPVDNFHWHDCCRRLVLAGELYSPWHANSCWRIPTAQWWSALGIDIQMLFSLVFALGAVLAGLAGMLVAPISEASIGMGGEIIITAFVVIIIGGIGSMKGAFIAAIIVGLIDTLGRSFLDDIFKLFMSTEAAENSAPAVSAMLVYILMAAVLAFKPQGLFPPKVR